jgi:hypothetical protein
MLLRTAHATTSSGGQLLPLSSVLVEVQQHSGTLVDMEKGWKRMFPFGWQGDGVRAMGRQKRYAYVYAIGL